MICFRLIKKESEAFLEIAAMATVCDVMPLFDENRILVKEGLRRIRQTEIVGLQALIEANHLEDKKLSSYHFGFILDHVLMPPDDLLRQRRHWNFFFARTKKSADRKQKHLLL